MLLLVWCELERMIWAARTGMTLYYSSTFRKDETS
jgi:hypothetical protein